MCVCRIPYSTAFLYKRIGLTRKIYVGVYTKELAGRLLNIRSNTVNISVNIYRSGQPYTRQTLCTPKCTYSIHTVFMIGQIQ